MKSNNFTGKLPHKKKKKNDRTKFSRDLPSDFAPHTTHPVLSEQVTDVGAALGAWFTRLGFRRPYASQKKRLGQEIKAVPASRAQGRDLQIQHPGRIMSMKKVAEYYEKLYVKTNNISLQQYKKKKNGHQK